LLLAKLARAEEQLSTEQATRRKKTSLHNPPGMK